MCSGSSPCLTAIVQFPLCDCYWVIVILCLTAGSLHRVTVIVLILSSSSGGPSLSFPLPFCPQLNFLAQFCSSAASHCFRPCPRDPSYLAASRWFFVTRLGFGYRSARVEVFQRFFSRPFLHSHARVLERESYQVGFCCCRELCFSVSFEVSCCKISSV